MEILDENNASSCIDKEDWMTILQVFRLLKSWRDDDKVKEFNGNEGVNDGFSKEPSLQTESEA